MTLLTVADRWRRNGKQCRREIGLRNGTCLERPRMEFRTLNLFIYCWSEKVCNNKILLRGIIYWPHGRSWPKELSLRNLCLSVSAGSNSCRRLRSTCRDRWNDEMKSNCGHSTGDNPGLHRSTLNYHFRYVVIIPMNWNDGGHELYSSNG